MMNTRSNRKLNWKNSVQSQASGIEIEQSDFDPPSKADSLNQAGTLHPSGSEGKIRVKTFACEPVSCKG